MTHEAHTENAVYQRWKNLARVNQTNRLLKEHFILSECKPTHILLPDTDATRFRKNGDCERTKNQIIPYWDDRYKHEFRLGKIYGIDGTHYTRSRKHEIWIGNLFPNFILNESNIERFEYKMKTWLGKEIANDYTLGEAAKIVAFNLLDIFVLTLYNTLRICGGNEWWMKD